jgi:hypothetical protein
MCGAAAVMVQRQLGASQMHRIQSLEQTCDRHITTLWMWNAANTATTAQLLDQQQQQYRHMYGQPGLTSATRPVQCSSTMSSTTPAAQCSSTMARTTPAVQCTTSSTVPPVGHAVTV